VTGAHRRSLDCVILGAPGAGKGTQAQLLAPGGSATLLVTAMLLASSVPAWRAARLEPNAMLRQE
jgi:predicted ATPase